MVKSWQGYLQIWLRGSGKVSFAGTLRIIWLDVNGKYSADIPKSSHKIVFLSDDDTRVSFGLSSVLPRSILTVKTHRAIVPLDTQNMSQ